MGVEKTRVGTHRDFRTCFVSRTIFGREIALAPRKVDDIDPVLVPGLEDRLGDELPGWAQIDRPVAQFYAPPVRNEQTDEGFSAPSGQL